MTDAAIIIRPPNLDDPTRRLIWIIPAAIAIWTILLSGFSMVLRQTKAPPMELKPLEARIVEIPPEVRGLQSGGEPHPAPAVAPKPKTRPEPIVKPHPVSRPTIKKTTAPPVIRSPYGTEKTTEAPDVESAPATGAGSSTSSGTETGTGEGSAGAGLGSDTLGARAIYAPTPTIPDDLREDVMQTEAIAHFTVSFDGASEVTLAKPTSNPRLNQVLLDTLKQWKFFPAMKNGVALASSFDVRIPISVK